MTEHASPRRKVRVRLIALLAFLPAIVLATAWAWYWSTGSSSGTIVTGVTDTTAQPAKPETQELKTAYFSTFLPANLRIQHNTTASKIQVIAHSSTQAAKIGFTADNLPSGGLAEIGDYHMRLSLTDTYLPYKAAYLPSEARAFQKTGSGSGATLDEVEMTVFLPHDSRYASITASGSAAKRAEIERTLKTVLATWQWR